MYCKRNLIEGCSRNRGLLEDIPEINQNQSESIPSLSLSAEDMDAIRFLSCKISLWVHQSWILRGNDLPSASLRQRCPQWSTNIKFAVLQHRWFSKPSSLCVVWWWLLSVIALFPHYRLTDIFFTFKVQRSIRSADCTTQGEVKYLVLDFTPVTTADFSAVEAGCTMRDTSRYLKQWKQTGASEASEAGKASASCEALSDVVENFRERGRLMPPDAGWSGGAYGQPINCVLCSWKLRPRSLNVPTVASFNNIPESTFWWLEESMCSSLLSWLALIA